MIHRILRIAILGMMAAGCATMPEVIRQEPAGLVYDSARPANKDIYLFEEAGAEPVALTDFDGLDYDPILSEDGRYVIFTSERTGDADLYVIDLAMSRQARPLITGAGSHEDQATLSPDNSSIVFVSSRDGEADIMMLPFVPRRETPVSAAINLTRAPGGDFRPAFSPDGTAIAFSTDRYHAAAKAGRDLRVRPTEIALLDLASGDTRRLTYHGALSGSPAWSVDGSALFHHLIPLPGATVSDGDSHSAIMKIDLRTQQSAALYRDATNLLVSPVTLNAERIAFLAGPHESAGNSTDMTLVSIGVDGADPVVERTPPLSHFSWHHNESAGFVAHGPGAAGTAAIIDAAALFGTAPLPAGSDRASRQLGRKDVTLFPVSEVFLGTGTPIASDSANTARALPVPAHAGIETLSSTRAGHPVSPTSTTPDRRSILYSDGDLFGGPLSRADIWMIGRDGTGKHNLTPDSPGNDAFPVVSPDGQWVYFRSGRSGDFDIYRMALDGSALTQLTHEPAADTYPVISPDGRKLAFISDRHSPEAGRFDVYLADITRHGTLANVTRITTRSAREDRPAFSPDGRWLVFSSDMSGALDEPVLASLDRFAPQPVGDLYAYDLHRHTLTRLTADKWQDAFPAFVQQAPDARLRMQKFAGDLRDHMGELRDDLGDLRDQAAEFGGQVREQVGERLGAKRAAGQ